MSYDKFQVGDRVWSELFGFAEISDYIPEQNAVKCSMTDEYYLWITTEGQLMNFDHRPRNAFHAVADTDEGMREAIARGEGLKRPGPRGRWPIQPGDRVLALGVDLRVEAGNVVAQESSEYYKIIIPNSASFTHSGLYSVDQFLPRAMRLYDGEEPFEDPCENMRWMMDEAIKFGWHEKYGKG